MSNNDSTGVTQAHHAYERYHTLIHLSPEGIWRCDLERPIGIRLPAEEQISLLLENARLSEANSALARMHGYESPQELHGKRLMDLMIPANARSKEILLRFIRSNYRLTDMDSNEVGRDGKVKHVRKSLIGVVIDGQLVSAWGTQRNITAEVESRERLQQSELRLRMASHAGRVGLWDWNPMTNELYWSDQVKEIYGVSPETEANMDLFTSLIHPEDLSTLQSRIRAALDPENRQPYICRHRIIVSGQVKYTFGYGQVFFDEHKNPIRMSGTVLDETVQREAEMKAIQLHELGAALAKSMTSDDILAIIDDHARQSLGAESVTIYLNSVTGFRRSRGSDAKDFSEVSRQINFTRQAMFCGTSHKIKGLAPDRSLAALPLNLNQSLIGMIQLIFAGEHDFDDDSQRHLLTFADISAQALDRARLYENERSARLEAESANKAKSRFLANMSHEIRTPLGAILGFAELLQNHDMPLAERRQYLDIILRNGGQLNNVIKDILDISKIESDHFDLEFLDFDCVALVREVIGLFDLQARERSVSLELRTCGEIPKVISSDPARLRQILVNLIGNAIKFTHGGRVVVSVSCETEKGTTRRFLRFRVADSGVGIAPEHHSRIFEPFMQADTSTTRQYGGTGLGLVIAKRLAQALGGDLILETSTPGIGSSFAFSIVALEKSGQQELGRGISEEPGHLILGGINVMVVDDTIDNRLLVSRFLTAAGAEVSCAHDGRSALDALKTASFDMILLDIQMPGMDGFGTLRQLRACGFDKPILALTAHAMEGDRELSLRAGFNDHIVKPIDRICLIDCVSRHHLQYLRKDAPAYSDSSYFNPKSDPLSN